MANSQFDIMKFSDYVSPEMKSMETKDGDLKFHLWGQKNEYWSYLDDLFVNSPSNAACINGIVSLVIGQGLRKDGAIPAQIYSKMMPEDINRAVLQFYKTGKIVVEVELDENGEVKKAFSMPGERYALGEKNSGDEITYVVYCKKWGDKRYKHKRIPTLGHQKEGDERAVLFYQITDDCDRYYGPVFYQSAIQYSEIEIETSNFHLNLAYNAFLPTAIINMNNGIPNKVDRQKFTREVVGKRTGSNNAGKIIINWNANKDAKAEIEAFRSEDQHKQFEYISNEAREKIFLGHRITSPLLLGIKDDSGGFGSNAEEMDQAFRIFNVMVIEPIRKGVLDALKKIFGASETMGLEFKPVDLFQSSNTEEPTTKPTETKMNDQVKLTQDDEKFWIDHLKGVGEKIDSDEYEIMTIEEADHPFREKYLIENLKKFDTQLPTTLPEPQLKSELDPGLFKVRFRYSPRSASSVSREFCKFMVDQAQSDIVYRLEDIDLMSSMGVNGQFAERGQSTYNIFLYKGGVNCKHRWERVVYFRRRNRGQFIPRSVTSQLENEMKVSISEARSMDIPDWALTPAGWDKAKTKPWNMPNHARIN